MIRSGTSAWVYRAPEIAHHRAAWIAGLMVLVSLVASSAAWQARQQAAELQARMRSLAPASASAPMASAMLARDFTADWPATLSAEAWMRAAQQAAQSGGLQLRSIASATGPGSTGTIPQTDVMIELRGRYPAIKTWLAEMSTRQAGSALLTLELRHAGAGGPGISGGEVEVELALRFRLHGRPVMPDALASSIGPR